MSKVWSVSCGINWVTWFLCVSNLTRKLLNYIYRDTDMCKYSDNVSVRVCCRNHEPYALIPFFKDYVNEYTHYSSKNSKYVNIWEMESTVVNLNSSCTRKFTMNLHSHISSFDSNSMFLFSMKASKRTEPNGNERLKKQDLSTAWTFPEKLWIVDLWRVETMETNIPIELNNRWNEFECIHRTESELFECWMVCELCKNIRRTLQIDLKNKEKE